MIKIIGLTAAILTLASCASPVGNMLNNKFVSITPQAAPKSLVGIWTGSMGPYLTSFSFKDDGYGVFCYSYGTADVLQRVKYANNIIYNQDGTKLEIKESTNDLLVVNANACALISIPIGSPPVSVWILPLSLKTNAKYSQDHSSFSWSEV
jgi:hypothetical protein